MTTLSNRWRLFAGLLLAILAMVAFFWFARQKATTQTAGGRFGLGVPMAVATATVTSGNMPVTIAALGTVSPLATAIVKAQISGQLQQIAFKEGQMVHKGDFLAQIDPRPYQNALAQAQGTLARDQALLKDAKLDLVRYRELLTEDSIASQQLDTQQALVQQLEGTVAADTAQVNAARLNLQYTHVVAPIDGRAGLRQVDIGNYVTAGDANGIVVIAQLQPITAIFPVPEDRIPDLMKRLRSGATLAVTARNRDDTATLANGTLITVDNEMDTTTGTVKLRAQFDNQDLQLFPNQFVNIQLLVDTLRGQIIVPTAAVQHGTVNGAAGTFVFLVKPDSTVTAHTVTMGLADGERVTIVSGLAVGDAVVTEGGDRLRDGAKVLLHGAAPGNRSSAPAGADSDDHAHRSGWRDRTGVYGKGLGHRHASNSNRTGQQDGDRPGGP
jgi:multidrug efflux system membrane fusion protein